LAFTFVPASAQELPDTFQLGRLVVTATRIPTSIGAVPVAVTVLMGDDLRSSGIRFVADALRGVPGASVFRSGSHGGITSLFLRGGESDYVQVMVDGVVLNDPGGAIDLGQLTTDNIDRIEVVRGPVSVLYGSDAVTGVVHIITSQGEGRARLTVGGDVSVAGRLNGDTSSCPGYPSTPCPEGSDLGSYTTRFWDATLTGGSSLVQYSLSASIFDTDGAYAFNNDYVNRTASGRIRVREEGVDVALTARYTEGIFHFPTDGTGRLTDENMYRSSESLAIGLEAGHFLSPRLEVRAALTYHDGDYRTVDEPDALGDTLGFFASTSSSGVDRRKAVLWGNLHLPASAIATLGFEVERQAGVSDFASKGQFGSFESSTSNGRSNRAVYAQVVVAPTMRLTATAGARTEDNDRFGSFRVWRAGASLRVLEGTTLRASAGTAFKEPTFFENFAEGFTRGNPALKPEQSRSWEIGLGQAFLEGRVAVDGTWFDQRFRNLIQFTGQPAPDHPNYTNIGEASSRGLEIEVRIGRVDGRSLTGSWVRLNTEVTDAGIGADPLFQQGQALIRRPRNRVHFTGTAPLGTRLRGGGMLAVVGARPDLDFLTDPSGARVTMPRHAVLDLYAEYRVIKCGSHDVTVRLRIDNLLDDDYSETSNFPAPGRALSLSMQAGTGF
jgi:vitamin B12 transporter